MVVTTVSIYFANHQILLSDVSTWLRYYICLLRLILIHFIGLMVLLDNSTRWNSTFLSIKRAIDIQRRIDVFCYAHRDELAEDILSEDDWTYLKHVVVGLQPFHYTTLRLEGRATHGHHGAIWEALPVLAYLMGQVEKGRELWAQQATTEITGRGSNRVERVVHHPMEIAYQNAWEKLTKYYKKTDDAHAIYAAAVLLHPSHRKRWFDDHWVGVEQQYIDPMIANVKKIWYDNYEGFEVPETQVVQHIDPIDEFLNAMNRDLDNQDPFDHFIYGRTLAFAETDGVIDWILKEGNMPTSVRQQALDLLSIPAMSAELERVFSSAKLLVTHRRNSLSAESIELLELLRYWWVNNIIQQERGGGNRAYRKRKAIEVTQVDGEV
jgi:hypothetical protein